jgi:hypothetical protein
VPNFLSEHLVKLFCCFQKYKVPKILLPKTNLFCSESRELLSSFNEKYFLGKEVEGSSLQLCNASLLRDRVERTAMSPKKDINVDKNLSPKYLEHEINRG